MSGARLESPLPAPGSPFKRRTSPPRTPGSPGMSFSPGGSLPGLGMNHRTFLRAVIISAIIIPTFYVLFGQPVTYDSVRDGQSGEGEWSAAEGYGRGGVARRVRGWSGGSKQWLGKSVSRNDDDEYYQDERPSGGETMLDLEEDMPVTVYEGGVAGYSVFTNLYLSAGSLMFIESDTGLAGKKLPGVRQIISGPKRGEQNPAADEDRWRVVGHEMASAELGKRAVLMNGVTYLFNDVPGGDGYLIYFQHFVAEAFLGASRVLAHLLQSQDLLTDTDSVPLPRRVWFPRCGWKPSWRDDRGENAWFLAHALPGATVEDANGWEDRSTAGLPVVFEKVVLVDRWAAHSNGGEVGKWGKMNADVSAMKAPRTFWNGIRQNIMQSLGVDGASSVGARGLPVVVFVDVHTGTPKVQDEDKRALIEALKGLTDIAEVHVTKVSAMTKAERAELLGRAEIIIGVHTNDLYEALWMPATENSAIIELFEEGGFDRSFELLATSLNHQYIAIQNDKILGEAEWRGHGSTRGEHSKGYIRVNGELVAKTVRSLLRGRADAEPVTSELDDLTDLGTE